MFLFLILCLVVNLKAQSDIIISEGNNYLLRVKNLGNKILHFHILYYSGAQGTQQYERYVDEEYKKKNLPFISTVNSLFD